MRDLIDRQAAIDTIREHKRNVLGQREWDEGVIYGYSAAHEHICDIIKTLPTIEERKKGKWKAFSAITCACSECGQILADWIVSRSNYCPNCGAKMGESDETD